RCGLTIGIEDVVPPPRKNEILDEYENKADKIQREYDRGLITDNERRQELTEVWAQATDEVAKNMEDNFPEDNPVWMMVQSGARGHQLHPRSAQGVGRHRPAYRRLGLPDPSSGGRGAGRHRPRGGLRHGPFAVARDR